MEEKILEESVRDRLILAGLRELDEHGAKDFSLRRVAILAGVSCAAPYRHFADKEELIRAIIAYVREGWELLCQQISAAFSSDARAKVIEMSLAGVRFWIAGGDFRSVLLYGAKSTDREGEMSGFEQPLTDAARQYACEIGISEAEAELLCFKLLSHFYGTLMMIHGGTVSPEEAISSLRAVLKDELK